jgi:hypothetical protein
VPEQVVKSLSNPIILHVPDVFSLTPWQLLLLTEKYYHLQTNLSSNLVNKIKSMAIFVLLQKKERILPSIGRLAADSWQSAFTGSPKTGYNLLVR